MLLCLKVLPHFLCQLVQHLLIPTGDRMLKTLVESGGTAKILCFTVQPSLITSSLLNTSKQRYRP